jgi:Sigma-70, region 4
MRRPLGQISHAFEFILIDGRSYEDVADHFHCPIGTIKSRVNRACLPLPTIPQGTKSGRVGSILRMEEIMKSKTAKDAKGAFAPSQAKRDSSGVESAKPTVIPDRRDATVNKAPPDGKKDKDWNINYDISEVKQDNNQG